MLPLRPLVLLIGSAVLLGGCANTTDYSQYRAAPTRLPAPPTQAPAPAITAPVTNPIRPPANYTNRYDSYSPYNAVDHKVRTYSDRINVQDLVEISVYKAPDLSKTVRVDSAGFITMPLIGRVQARGLSVEQLERQIANQLSKDFMKDPQVNVLVKESSQNRITVEGAVKQSGVFPVQGDLTLLQAIALAGGLVETSDDNQVMLFRRSGQRVVQQRIDLAAVRRGNAPDVPLKQDDRIVVLEAALNRRVVVEGAVNSPGVFPIKGRMTVLQALALAGGANRLADTQSAVLLRYAPDGRSLRYRVDLKAIRTGRAADPELAPDDRLIVQQSEFRDIIDQAKGIVAPINLFP